MKDRVTIGINGFGRIGRLAARVIADRQPWMRLLRVNETGGDARAAAHAWMFDSVHGRWGEARVGASDTAMMLDGDSVAYSSNAAIGASDWRGCDVVIEASGRFRKAEQLDAYFQQDVRKVAVAAPVNDARALNVVVGVNDAAYDPQRHHIVTAASCTTNCLAPLVAVLHAAVGIERGTILTVHNMTNTQANIDSVDDNLRRARAAGLNLFPTTTGSARAIADIFPGLAGRLDGHAVRVPLLNASLTDFTFTAVRDTTVEAVNAALEQASRAGPLCGILGFESRALVSSDYRGDPRSSIVDATSTLVVDGRMVKVLAWYDNEWGYANRLVELVARVARDFD